MKLVFATLLLLLSSPLLFSQTTADSALVYVCPPCNSSCDTLTFQAPGLCNHCSMPLLKESEVAKTKKPLRIAFYLQDGVEVLDFAAPLEVFSYAGFDIFTVSKTNAPIKSQGILKITPDYGLNNAPKADILAFFGGNAARAYKDPTVIDWIKRQEDIQYYFSVCTGAFLLAEAGLLIDKSATTFHLALPSFTERYPKTKVLPDARFVDNGRVITTAGISAGIDGALHFVAKIHGVERAKMVAYQIEYDKWTPGEGVLLDGNDLYEAQDRE